MEHSQVPSGPAQDGPGAMEREEWDLRYLSPGLSRGSCEGDMDIGDFCEACTVTQSQSHGRRNEILKWVCALFAPTVCRYSEMLVKKGPFIAKTGKQDSMCRCSLLAQVKEKLLQERGVVVCLYL